MLEGLIPIIDPEPISLWPSLLPGWIIVGIVFALIVVAVGIRLYRRYKHNEYRRNALAQVEMIVGSTGSDGRLHDDRVNRLSLLLKQVALQAFPRKRVASLSGDDWYQFLKETSGPRSFTAASVKQMSDAAFQRKGASAGSSDGSTVEMLADDIRRWIRGHHA
jgi:hypothetical protein